MIRDPESFDLVLVTDGQPVARDVLGREITSEVAALADERAVMTALRRFKQRETLRIAYGDLVKHQRIDTVVKQISYLADAICEAAVQAARRKLQEQRGVPRAGDGTSARFVALALGKLGGVELNYSSDIDLVFLYDTDGQTDGARATSNLEFFDRLARQVIKLLSDATEHGVAYRVDMRLRPEGSQGPIVMSREAALHYYDVLGRTWERQAFVKARPVAGDISLGREFLSQLEPWVYRRYLTLADIAGIKALKRRIEQRAAKERADERDVKTGRGGIRDIEFVIQFLQLLNGGDLPQIRTPSTLDGIAALEQAGCLTMQERTILEENYAFLRKIEHRLQIMFDLQTHALPEGDDELRKLAVRMDYSQQDKSPLARFKSDYQSKTELNRKILDHLLHSAFGDDSAAEPEGDLVLDPEPSEATISETLGKYGFRDVPGAYQNLMALASEKVAFLSVRRCRHFLAAIAPRLLSAVAATPDPDFTLLSLSRVSDSLGGKGVLWELFSASPPSLRLYVTLCASSPYLSSILTGSPGMIDELMDSLVLDKLPTEEQLAATLDELCRAAEDIEPILHSFKNSQHLRVGVRDILGKEDLPGSHRALANVAEACLSQIAQREYERLVEKHGEPIIVNRPREGQVSEFVMLALGKLGAREPNYHSDLDLIFLYESDGNTRHRQRSRRDAATTNQHFFSQLGQRIVKVASQLGPHGKLYDVDARLRPTGKSGALATSLVEFGRYFAAEGGAQLWERQALCKARPISGSPAAREQVKAAVYDAITALAWRPEFADEIRRMRRRLEQSATPRNIKRGAGGTVDIEFIVEMLQLKHAAMHPEVLATGTLGGIAALLEAGVLSDEDASFLHTSYRFLRSIEARIRLMNTAARHDLPNDEGDLRKLAFLFQYPSAEELRRDCEHFTSENRRRFEQIFDREGTSVSVEVV
jgi:glutamate-ammonia-ligase adenylyltransferase